MYIRFHRLRHPKDLGANAVEAFLTWLADERRVASSTHRQALSALLFLYGKVLDVNPRHGRGSERRRCHRKGACSARKSRERMLEANRKGVD